MDREIEAQTIAMQIKKSAGSILNEIKVFDVYTGKGIDENKKSIAFSLNFGKMNATLTDEEINSAICKKGRSKIECYSVLLRLLILST